MDTPVRKYQKQKDYQRHKLFRKMKRRRKAAIEQAKDAPMKPLRRKFKIPKFEGGKEGSQQMQLGPRYWADQTIYHDWQNSTIDGGALPEVIVSPTNDASWLFSTGKYVHNPRKPLADKYTRKVVSDYLSKFDDESAKDYNERISRLADVLDIRGVQFKKNDVKSGKLKGRAHYNHQSATAYIDSMKDIFAEVAHPWQYAKGNNNIEEEVGTGKYDSDSDPRGGTRYAYPDTAEGETHSFFEPALTEWIETGKISKSSPILNNELSRQKIKPKDRMEVADSASSWNRQAIERRLLANPDQLPLYKRIQYGLFDYPLLDKKKALGGNLFDDGKDDKPNVFQLPDGTFVNSHNEPLDVLDYAGVEDPTKWTYVDKRGNRYTPKATRTLTEGEQFTQRQIENEQNTRPFEFTPYIEGANEGAAAASLMMGFPFNMAGSAYYTAKASRDAYNRNYLGAALNGLGAVTPTGSGILQSAKRLLPKEKTLITAENAASITPTEGNVIASGYSINLQEALDNPAFDFTPTGVPRTWWDIMSRKKPDLALSRWEKLGKDLDVKNPIYTDRTGAEDAKNIFNSDWYQKRLADRVSNPEEVTSTFNTRIDKTPLIIQDPGIGFGMEAAGKNISKVERGIGLDGKEKVIVDNKILLHPDMVGKTGNYKYSPENYLDDVVKHETLHASSGTGHALPREVRANNYKYHMTPKYSRESNPSMYDYMSVDDEQRTRLLKFAELAETKFGGDYNKAFDYVNDHYYNWAKDGISHDVLDLVTNFNKEDVVNSASNILGWVAPLAGGTALFGYNSLGQPADTYKHGKDSGIHINPKNRGKFNALKKRTGKTTEQLTHSKNPLTRKRAIFAQNAKKWKH